MGDAQRYVVEMFKKCVVCAVWAGAEGSVTSGETKKSNCQGAKRRAFEE